jgi:hypothetical protein
MGVHSAHHPHAACPGHLGLSIVTTAHLKNTSLSTELCSDQQEIVE